MAVLSSSSWCRIAYVIIVAVTLVACDVKDGEKLTSSSEETEDENEAGFPPRTAVSQRSSHRDVTRHGRSRDCTGSVMGHVISLLPLASESPRITTEYQGWNFSFVPCYDIALQTDHCRKASLCKWQKHGESVTAIAIGERKQTKFILKRRLVIKRTNGNHPSETTANQYVPSSVSVVDNGNLGNKTDGNENTSQSQPPSPPDSHVHHHPIHTFRSQLVSENIIHFARPQIFLEIAAPKYRQKSYIRMVCDRTRVTPDSAIFRISNTSLQNSNNIMLFELHHLCCCLGGCSSDNLSASASSNNTISSTEQNPSEVSRGRGRGDHSPRQLWLVIVVNGAVVVIALIIGSMCCRGGSPAIYRTRYDSIGLPGGSLVRSTSHATVASIDSRVSRISGPTTSAAAAAAAAPTAHRMKSPERLDYSSRLLQSAQLPLLDKCEISKHELDLGQRLGGGVFGDTYMCEWKDRQVAAKRVAVGIHQGQLSTEDHQWLVKHVFRLSHQRHKHLVSVLGICVELRLPHIITELVDCDSLRDLLNRGQVDWPRRLRLVLNAADGMAFLHSATPPILHRDLRAANILVDRRQDIAKVCDFGMTKVFQRLRQRCNSNKTCFCRREWSALPALIRWTAPEVLARPMADEEQQSDVITPASDVYSFGMLLWEVATVTDPFYDIPDDNEVMSVVTGGGRPPVDGIDDVPRHMKELMKSCWDHTVSNRPNFKSLALFLKNLLHASQKTFLRERHDTGRSRSDSINSYLKKALHLSQDI